MKTKKNFYFIDYDPFSEKYNPVRGTYRKLPVPKDNFYLPKIKNKKAYAVYTSQGNLADRFRNNQCIIKVNYFSTAGRPGQSRLRRKLDYIMREGCSADHPDEKTPIYGSEKNREDFLAKARDKRFFSLIVSPEKTTEYFTSGLVARHIMSCLEKETGQQLVWEAADHYNTNQPHTHILIRGKDAAGGEVYLDARLISAGMREEACRYTDAVLGTKTDMEVYTDLYRRITSENVTKLDRYIASRTKYSPMINGRIYIRPKTAVEEKRLCYLSNRGLASSATIRGRKVFALVPDFIQKMTAAQEKKDILKQMDFSLPYGATVIKNISKKTVPETGDNIRILAKKPDTEEHGGYRYIARNSRTGDVYWFSADGSFRTNTTVKGSDLLGWRFWRNTPREEDKEKRRKRK